MKFWYPSLAWPAKNIRLLKLLPAGSDDEIIKGTLSSGHPVGSAECPPYTALSYTWGPESPTHDIQINGQTFPIRENLWRFLCQLQRTKRHEFIWTDAICIDQKSIGEKNAQVSIMHLVYRNAESVLVWLGEAYEGSDRVLDEANAQPELFHESCSWPFCRSGDVRDGHRVLVPDAESPVETITSLIQLCARPYWSRTWILQEITLASNEVYILCGSAMTTLRHLGYFIWCAMGWLAERYPDPIKDGYIILAAALPYRISQFDNPGEGWPLDLLLDFSKDSLCADTRDKIYAVQSMSSQPMTRVDYRIGLIDLYWEVLYHCNSSSKDFVRKVGDALGIVDHPGLRVLEKAQRPGFIAISPFHFHRKRIEAERQRQSELDEGTQPIL